jgi:hypothetical protein
MPKKKQTNKLPCDDSDVAVIYGIICLKTKKLLKVHLSEKEIWYEFNTGMYDETKYSVIKLDIKVQ